MPRLGLPWAGEKRMERYEIKIKNGESEISKFAQQFHLSADEIFLIKELEKEQEKKLQNKNGRWFFKPVNFLN